LLTKESGEAKGILIFCYSEKRVDFHFRNYWFISLPAEAESACVREWERCFTMRIKCEVVPWLEPCDSQKVVKIPSTGTRPGMNWMKSCVFILNSAPLLHNLPWFEEATSPEYQNISLHPMNNLEHAEADVSLRCEGKEREKEAETKAEPQPKRACWRQKEEKAERAPV